MSLGQKVAEQNVDKTSYPGAETFRASEAPLGAKGTSCSPPQGLDRPEPKKLG